MKEYDRGVRFQCHLMIVPRHILSEDSKKRGGIRGSRPDPVVAHFVKRSHSGWCSSLFHLGDQYWERSTKEKSTIPFFTDHAQPRPSHSAWLPILINCKISSGIMTYVLTEAKLETKTFACGILMCTPEWKGCLSAMDE